MKRSGFSGPRKPMKRTPFKVTDRKPLARTPMKRPTHWGYTATNPLWPVVKKEVRERSGGRCEVRVPGVCTGRGEQVHHVILRGQGGPDELWNLLDACAACHRYVHDHPAESYENEWLRKGLAG